MAAIAAQRDSAEEEAQAHREAREASDRDRQASQSEARDRAARAQQKLEAENHLQAAGIKEPRRGATPKRNCLKLIFANDHPKQDCKKGGYFPPGPGVLCMGP